MIIRVIAPRRAIEIDDPPNFKAFSVRIEGAFGGPAGRRNWSAASRRATATMPGFPNRYCATGRRSNPNPGGRTGCLA
jgi:hypothetical protein